jgi:hypothetical protein
MRERSARERPPRRLSSRTMGGEETPEGAVGCMWVTFRVRYPHFFTPTGGRNTDRRPSSGTPWLAPRRVRSRWPDDPGNQAWAALLRLGDGQVSLHRCTIAGHPSALAMQCNECNAMQRNATLQRNQLPGRDSRAQPGHAQRSKGNASSLVGAKGLPGHWDFLRGGGGWHGLASSPSWRRGLANWGR